MYRPHKVSMMESIIKRVEFPVRRNLSLSIFRIRPIGIRSHGKTKKSDMILAVFIAPDLTGSVMHPHILSPSLS